MAGSREVEKTRRVIQLDLTRCIEGGEGKPERSLLRRRNMVKRWQVYVFGDLLQRRVRGKEAWGADKREKARKGNEEKSLVLKRKP